MEDWGKLLGDAVRGQHGAAAVSAMLDRLLTAAEELLEIIMRRYERASCTTAMCSSAVHGAGVPKPTCHHWRRQGRTFSVLDGQSRWPVLK
ncbi:MAG TPA: hypothetical protein VH350_16365 [Candidatus Sulfotelmatobacter sp.]|nr:hypothetical protein [Candidatus Sulfotelmatobacter sp.]